MLKNILNLEGAQQLSKKEQSSINGGGIIVHVVCGNIQPGNEHFCYCFPSHPYCMDQ